MYSDYIDILAKSCKAAFHSMTNSEISKVWMKQDDQLSPTFSVGFVLSYKGSDSNKNGNFVIGFADEPMAVFVASAFAEKIKLPPVEEIDETASDILNEFMNIAVGNAISEWEKAGLGIQFERPVMVKNKDFQNAKAETYQITLELQDGQNGQNRAFDHVMLKVSCTTENQIQPDGEGKRILVAEDSGVMSKILSAALKESGFVVEQAINGEEAVAKHKVFHPDLTVMDLYMPKMDGLGAIVEIRESEPDAKFIVLTSSSGKDEVMTAKTLNVVDYVLKTGEMEEIVGKVKNALV